MPGTLKIAGQTFGMLTAIESTGQPGSSGTIWRFLCACGNETLKSGSEVKRGRVTSCGCLLGEPDITGQKFNALTALGPTKYGSPGSVIVWKWLCDCGQTINRTAARVQRGDLKSCGCSAIPRNMLGQKFSKLLVTGIAPKRSGKTAWYCTCDCGKTQHAVTQNALVSGTTTSCGCAKNRTSSENPLWTGCGEISGHTWSHIKANAVHPKRSAPIPFALTIEEAWQLFLDQGRCCALTGVELTFKAFGTDSTQTASLDRIDSGKGYAVDNIQWIHKRVNLMKNTQTDQEFIEMCRLVVAHADRLDSSD